MKLAQMNIAQAKYPLDGVELKDFMDNLDPINGLAEASDGFVWRLQDESGDATSIKVFDDPSIIVNMSVWASIDSLKNFIFRSHHKDFLSRKKEWFTASAEQTYVLWWIADDHIPTVEEGVERLLHLREFNDTPHAFSFKSNFQPEEIF